MSPRARPVLTTALASASLGGIILALDDAPLMMAGRNQLWGLGALHYAEFDKKLPARQTHNWYAGVGTLEPEASAPVLHPVGGRYEGSVDVTVLASEEDGSIRCSEDGSIPTLHHDEYVATIKLESTTVLRCRTFRRGNSPSITSTHTYVIDAPGQLPVLAMTVHPTNLWNKYTGIYAQHQARGSEWERDAYVEFFPNDRAAELDLVGRVRIHGGWSRSGLKKSFRFHYPSFDTGRASSNVLSWPSPVTERAVVFSARERMVNRDELFQALFATAGGLTSAKMPVHLYINGKSWGIYFVRERIDEEYLQRRVGPGRYDLLHASPGKPQVHAGDRRHWERMMEFFENTDLTEPAALSRAAELIDIENFTDYWLFNIYAANVDWPHHNMYMFARREGTDRRWRWLSWDSDFTFDYMGTGLTHHSLAWATRSTLRHDLRFNNERGLRDTEEMVASTLILRKLLQNDLYRGMFANRMNELLATHLHPENVRAALDEIHNELAGDLELDWARWDVGQPGTHDEQLAYIEDMERVRTFIDRRPGIVREHMRQLVANLDAADR